ncbi:MAG: DNA-binding transcriptional regulator [Pirellulaceae bacterium]|nr:DNA-binding transcriptional regulator [Pirellulaceae bacterium]
MQHRSIAVVMDHAISFYRELLAGIGSYVSTMPHWGIVPFLAEARGLASARCRNCDGLIGSLYTPALVEAALKLPIPAVTVSGVLFEYPIPRVSPDNEAVGRMAAEHFLERGYTQFAFVGYQKFDFSQQRLASYENRLRQSGFATESFLFQQRRNTNPGVDLLTKAPGLRKWLLDRPRPLALFAANAMLGFCTSIACQESGLRIPEDIALLDVDNDELLSKLSKPPNSSVALATHRMGFEAARMLDGLMSGTKPLETAITIPPIGVVVRQSSDALAIDDEDIAKAVRFIRQPRSQAITVAEVVRHMALSRTTVDRKFKELVGHSLAEEIRRNRRERAKTLLASSDLPIADVAQKTGYPGNIELSVDFRRNLGQTPTEYRQKFQIPRG